MKKKYIKIIGIALTVLTIAFMFESCTKNFEDINTDPYGISDQQLAADYKLVGEPFKQALTNIYTITPVWVMQLQQNLLGDVYSGYMMPPTPFRGNSNNMTYALVDGWNGFVWSVAYGDVMAPLANSDRKGLGLFPNFNAWAKIVRVEAMHRVSDHFGPIVYSNYGEPNENGQFLYDCQNEVYDQFFRDLDTAITVLTPYAQGDSVRQFSSFDLVYGGDYTLWVQFANSLRLRLAIRISKVDPARARTEAEAAISHPLGVITDNGGNFLVTSDAGLAHPLNTINNAWNDVRMGAPMDSYLNGYSDPRIDKYFQPSGIVEGEYRGIRQGINILAKSDYVNFSKLIDFGSIQLMTAAEVYFLKAEGALRGWNMGGSGKELYNQGITMSFAQYGLEPGTYLTDDASKPADYTDAFNNENDRAAVSDITIAWNEGDPFERKLERIITQKWIAMYPDGQEAWSEFRRTGYPKLFPVTVNNSGGTISTENFIKRVNFVEGEYQTNPEGVASGVQCLNGEDNGGTSLWWDVD